MEFNRSSNQTETPEAFPLARGWLHRPSVLRTGAALLYKVVLKSLYLTESFASIFAIHSMALSTVTGLPTFDSRASRRMELNSASLFP